MKIELAKINDIKIRVFTKYLNGDKYEHMASSHIYSKKGEDILTTIIDFLLTIKDTGFSEKNILSIENIGDKLYISVFNTETFEEITITIKTKEAQ